MVLEKDRYGKLRSQQRIKKHKTNKQGHSKNYI